MPFKDPAKNRSSNAASERRRRAKLKLRLVGPISPPHVTDVVPPSSEVRLRTASDVLAMFERAHDVLLGAGADGVTVARTLIQIAAAAGRVIGDSDVTREFAELKAEFDALKNGTNA